MPCGVGEFLCMGPASRAGTSVCAARSGQRLARAGRAGLNDKTPVPSRQGGPAAGRGCAAADTAFASGSRSRSKAKPVRLRATDFACACAAKAASASSVGGVEQHRVRAPGAAGRRRGRCRARRAPASRPRPAPSGTVPGRSSCQRRRARAAGLAVTNSFTGASGKTTVPMSRPSSTAPISPGKSRWKSSSAARTPGCAATALAAASASGPRRSGRARSSGCSARGRGFGRGRVGRVGAGVQHAAADGAVEQAGIEIGQAERGGEAAGERALAGGGRAVDGDDAAAHRDGGAEAPHQRGEAGEAGVDEARRRPPRPARCVARPSTSALMAMRWSIWVATRPPPGGRAGAVHDQRVALDLDPRRRWPRSSAAVAASRSLSFTRSSARPRMRVVPSAQAAATARTGYSSIMLGARSGGTSTPRSAGIGGGQVAHRLAALGARVGDLQVGAHLAQRRRTGRCAPG